ncbi:MAG: hypothetical protein AAFP19_21730 [Bacteroidota bacterium]
MKKITVLFFSIGLMSLMACQQENKTSLKTYDLLEYGVPVKILAPDSAEIETMDLVVQKDITVKKGKDYSIQIFSSTASTTDIKQLKANQMEEVRNNPFFSKVLKEEADGFIYELQIDSTHQSYGFRHFQIKGDNEYIFQTGLIGTFSQEAVEQMYEAVQPNKK